jgi:uncharacterized membrane protein YqjE
MADPALPPPADEPETTHGIVAKLLSLGGSFGRHIQALLALAGHESKEAATLYLKLLAVVVAALVFMVFGYVFLLLFVAFSLAGIFGISWIWISLGLAVLHLVAAAIGGFYVKTHIVSPVFTSTSSELKKDFDALGRLQP